MLSRRTKRIFSLILSLILIVSLLPNSAMAAGPGTGPIAFHEIYMGSGGATSTYDQKYVVLTNITGTEVDIGGWHLWRASDSGVFSTTANMYYAIPAGTKMAAGGYCIIKLQKTTGLASLPIQFNPDVVVLDVAGTFGPSYKNAKLVLTNSNTIPVETTDASVIDWFGYGSANKYLVAPAPVGVSEKAYMRIAHMGDNSTDYKTEVPTLSYLTDNLPSETKCATPAASPTGGKLAIGDTITLSTTTADASIYYTTDGSDPTVSSTLYSAAFAAAGTDGSGFTVKAIAVKAGLDNSDIATFTYTLNDTSTVKNIKDTLALPTDTKVTVEGQLVYFATTYSNPVIQSEIGGQVYSLYIYGAAPAGAKLGDTVRFSGTYKLYNGLPEVDTITDSSITSTPGTPMAAQKVTIAELISDGSAMLGRFVKIANVTLGNASGSNTPITDATGTINIYKAAPFPQGVTSGDVVDVYAMVACYNSTIQLYTGTAETNGFNVYDVVNDVKPPVVTLPDIILDAKVNQPYTVSVGAYDNKGLQSVTITYTIGGITKTDVAMQKNTETNMYELTIPGSEILQTANEIKYTIKATDVSALTFITAEVTVPISYRAVVTDVTPVRNSASGDNKMPRISVTFENGGDSPSVTLSLSSETANVLDNVPMTLESGSTYAYTPLTPLDDGKYTATVSIAKAGGVTTTETWSFYIGTQRYGAYFGQLHSHTAEYSDGSGTLQNGLDYIKAVPQSDNVDFVAFTDHSNYFDATGSGNNNPATALNNINDMTAASRTKWQTYTAAMRNFNTENAGSVVAIPGFEMTWSGGPGHINTFNSVGLISRNNTALNNKSADAGMKLYYETLILNSDPLANLSQFNHPGTTFGTFSDFAYYTPAYDSKMVAVEVGNGEGAIGSGGYFPSYAEYTKALDKGWHVAPTNNQDNHKGQWGNANTARTVIITDDFSETGLLTGLKNMSVYTTEDKNLNISYTVNGQMMGSTISDVPSAPLAFVVNVDDPDSSDVISKVEIVTNSGRIAANKTFTTNAANWEFELPSAQGYYYVRVTQADKNIAVTAPVWVGQAALVGINSFENSTKLPVTNEELTLTTKVFCNESSPATLKSITYKMGDTVLTSDSPNSTIPSMGVLTHTYKFTPTVAGLTNVSVAVVITSAGVDREFDANLSLNVRESEKLVYVGIDASHFNEYVNGNYKDSMGNFANMAVEYDVRVVELKTSEALIAAASNPKYQMLVLTPPTRRNGSNFLIGYKSYTDEEIAAIKSFAESGKTVIITGWADYYEGYTKYSDGTPHTLPADQHMAAQQNRLLTAIGASLRLSDDEIKDDVNNGGSSPRLYLTNYNTDNPFIARVKTDVQVYSNYGGSTVYAVNGSGQPILTLPSAVSPMVYAHSTSYSSDDDKDGFAGVAIPKYNDKYMVAASETVTHANSVTSTVIVTGSAFMSNFEIQADVDNWATPAYSNYTILENVVQSVNPTVVSDIKDVQAAPEGVTFTIQGIVTSNASGYDKDTAFFDCIYVQDGTAGINAFPVAGDIRAGQTVQVKGVTSSYNGERQIKVTKITIIDTSIKPLPAPVALTTAQAAAASNLGSLVKVSGQITRITTPNNVVESIYVKDSTGVECRVFIDGYITQTKTIANLKVGATLKATGLSSIDTEGARIRIRDRSDIVCSTPGTGAGGGTGGGTTVSDTNTGVIATGAIPPGAVLTVGELSLPAKGKNEAADAIRKEMGRDDTVVLFAKDIKLSTSFSGKLTITLPIDTEYNGRTVIILHDKNGTLERYTAIVQNGMVSFEVTSLSPFVVLLYKFGATVPNTGDTLSWQPGVLLIALAAASAVLSLCIRRGKNTREK